MVSELLEVTHQMWKNERALERKVLGVGGYHTCNIRPWLMLIWCTLHIYRYTCALVRMTCIMYIVYHRLSLCGACTQPRLICTTRIYVQISEMYILKVLCWCQMLLLRQIASHRTY